LHFTISFEKALWKTGSLIGVMKMKIVPSVDRLTSPQPFTPRMEEGDMNKFMDSIIDVLMDMEE
jgi:hypothetical protein